MSAPDQYGQSVQIWQMTDPPSIPDAAQALADGIIPRTVMRFASASARGATLTTPVEGMTTWLEDSNTFQIWNGSAWITPEPALVSGTTGLSPMAGWSVQNFFGHRQGRVTSLDFYLTRTGGTISSSNGNIGDIDIATMPTSWRPTHNVITGCWDSGTGHGGFLISTNGTITLRTSSNDIVAGANLRFQITFIRTTF